MVPFAGASSGPVGAAAKLTSPSGYCPISVANSLPASGRWINTFGDDFMADPTQGVSKGALHGWGVWAGTTNNGYTLWQPSTDGSIVNGYGYELPAVWNSRADGHGQEDAGGIGEPSAGTQTGGLYLWCQSVALDGLSQGSDYNDMDVLAWPSSGSGSEIDANEFTPYFQHNAATTTASYVHSGGRQWGGIDPELQLQFSQPNWVVFAMQWQPGSAVTIWECARISGASCADWQQLLTVTSYQFSIPSTSMRFDFEAQDTASLPSPGTNDVLAIAWFEQYAQGATTRTATAR
jgi:hypothetical protein